MTKEERMITDVSGNLHRVRERERERHINRKINKLIKLVVVQCPSEMTELVEWSQVMCN